MPYLLRAPISPMNLAGRPRESLGQVDVDLFAHRAALAANALAGEPLPPACELRDLAPCR